MGALPKNKITRTERGKRRRGNTPKFKKDPNTNSIPLHKRGIVASIFKAANIQFKNAGKTASASKAA